MADDILKKLQELVSVPELTSGFKTQQDCIAWANKVLPALVFNAEFRQEFMEYQQNINTVGLSGDLQASSLNQMVSILGLAIADRQHLLSQQPQLISEELLEYVDIFEDISGRFINGSTLHLQLDDEVYFSQKTMEVISLIKDYLGEKNQYTGPIYHTLNYDMGTYGPSLHCVQSVKGFILAAHKEIKRKESRNAHGGNMFKEFMTDSVSIVNKNGTEHQNVKASVQKNIILVTDISIPIESGDKIVRVLPSKVKEVFEVVDPGYHAGFGGIDAHYQIKYRRGVDAPVAHPQTIPHQIFNLHGDNARVNFHSTDSSTNIVNTNSAELFNGLLKLIEEQIKNANDRNSLIATVEAMRQSQGTSGFMSCYQEFMAVASDHISVFGPLLPALTKMLIPG
jgi:hypothetical protein